MLSTVGIILKYLSVLTLLAYIGLLFPVWMPPVDACRVDIQRQSPPISIQAQASVITPAKYVSDSPADDDYLPPSLILLVTHCIVAECYQPTSSNRIIGFSRFYGARAPPVNS